MKTICLYSELDSFSGYIRHDIQDLGKLIRDLKLTCLFYDQVIVNTPVIIEHPLTLPTFEIFSPFVRSGILWTSGQDNNQSPYEFISNRIKAFQDNKKTLIVTNELLNRWELITPNSWNLLRNVNNQVNNATNNIITNLSTLETSKSEAIYKNTFLEKIQRMQSDNVFNRDYLLANIGNLKNELSINTIHNISSIIQSEYIKQGSNNKGNEKIVIFPGKFVIKTNRTNILNNYLPVDTTTLPIAIRRFLQLGYSINTLLNLPIAELYLLATSDTWIKWRNHLTSENWTKENSNEMFSLYLSKIVFNRALEIVYTNLSPISIASEWQLIGKSLLGTFAKSIHKSNNNFILNLNTRSLYLEKNDGNIKLDYSHIILLSILISSGNTGVHIEQIKQLDIEKSLIKTQKIEYCDNYKKDEITEKSRLNRLYVLKNRINKKIASFGISIIINDKNCWVLNLPENHSILLSGSAWDLQDSKMNQNNDLPKLSKQNKKLYLLLKQHSPAFLGSKKIAEELLFNTSENTQKKVSDNIYKLQKKLKNSPYKIIRDYIGGYALICIEN